MLKERCNNFYGQRLCKYKKPSDSDDWEKRTNKKKVRILSAKEINEKYKGTAICERVKNSNK